MYNPYQHLNKLLRKFCCRPQTGAERERETQREREGEKSHIWTLKTWSQWQWQNLANFDYFTAAFGDFC